MSPDLKTGVIWAILSLAGTVPVDREELKIWARTVLIDGMIFKRLMLMSSSPQLLLVFNLDVNLKSSSLEVGDRKRLHWMLNGSFGGMYNQAVD